MAERTNKPTPSRTAQGQPTQALAITTTDMRLYARHMDEAQVNFLLQHTPEGEIKTRPARGGGTWSYVEVGYVIDLLNKVFSFQWDFEVISREILGEEIVVEGRLIVVTPTGQRISKTQFGGAEIKRHADKKKEWHNNQPVWVDNPLAGSPLSISNDFKAASSDALKKCASLLGIGLDLSGRERLEADDEPQQPQPTPPPKPLLQSVAKPQAAPTPSSRPVLQIDKGVVITGSTTDELFGPKASGSTEAQPSDWDRFTAWAGAWMSKKLGMADPLISNVLGALEDEGRKNTWLNDKDWLHDLVTTIKAWTTASEAIAHLNQVRARNSSMAGA